MSTIPTDVAKLTNKVANDSVAKTDINSMKTKVNENETDNDNLESKVTSNHLITETGINNLKTKFDGIDLTKYVLKSNFVVSSLLQTSSFNSKVNVLENKIKTTDSRPDISNLANNTELKNVENKIPDSNAFVKKTDYATEVSSIKYDYATNTSLSSQLNDLKSQHIADDKSSSVKWSVLAHLKS